MKCRMPIWAAFALLASAAPGTCTAEAAELGAADRAALFAAAGFKQQGQDYVRCEDTVTESRQPGRIELADLNGDGQPEAWVTESSTYCYGSTEQAFVLLAKDGAGQWHVLLDQVGIAVPLEARHQGWPDIEVGGPGFDAFPVYRFDGKAYVLPQ
jgi:hypothetical protein